MNESLKAELPLEGLGSSRGSDQSVVLFDGVCNLCNGSVQFIIKRDPHGYFRFASLQSALGERLMRDHGLDSSALSSVVLVEGGRAYERSTAVLRIARRLSGGWPLMAIFSVIPRPIRDLVYDWIGRNRYRWFGRMESCTIPTPELRSRFLDA